MKTFICVHVNGDGRHDRTATQEGKHIKGDINRLYV